MKGSTAEMFAPIFKRVPTLTLLVSLTLLCGCAHQYLIELKNGGQVISRIKPKLQGTSYYFRDTSGEEHVIPQGRVVKIKSVTVVNEEVKPVSPPKPKTPKHWYFLWLA